jgi:16S rRNA processing protein RimM
MLRVGKISGAHGLKGALRLRLDNPESDTIEKVTRLFLDTSGQAREFRVLEAKRLNAATIRIILEGVADANGADALKGAVVRVASEDVPARKEGEYYYYEVIGCEVFLTDGARLGKIEEVYSNGAHDVWIVRDAEREFLIPVIEDVVKAMNLAGKRVTIDPIPGLLD